MSLILNGIGIIVHKPLKNVKKMIVKLLDTCYNVVINITLAIRVGVHPLLSFDEPGICNQSM